MADTIFNWFGITEGATQKTPMDDVLSLFQGVGNAVSTLLGCSDTSRKPASPSKNNRIPTHPSQSISPTIVNRGPNKDSLLPPPSIGFKVNDGRAFRLPVCTHQNYSLQRVATQLNQQLHAIFVIIKERLQPLHNHNPNRFKPVLSKVSRFLVNYVWESSDIQVSNPTMVIGKPSSITGIIDLLNHALTCIHQFFKNNPPLTSNGDWDQISQLKRQQDGISDILASVQRLNEYEDDRFPPCGDFDSGNVRRSMDLTVATAVPIPNPTLNPKDVQDDELASKVLGKCVPPKEALQLYSKDLGSHTMGPVHMSVSPRPVVVLAYEDPKPFVRNAISKVKHYLMSHQIDTCNEELDAILGQMNSNVDSLKSTTQHRPQSLRPVACQEAIRLIDRTIGILNDPTQAHLPNLDRNIAALNRVRGVLLSRI